MSILEIIGFKNPIYARDGDFYLPLPEWAIGAIWLGWWCRKLQLDHHRLLVVAVLPSRDLHAAFSGLGSLIAGSQQFKGSLTWEDFCQFPENTEIFWKEAANTKRYGGIIIQRSEEYPEMINVRITSGLRSRIGTTWCISNSTFNDYIFSEENLPNQRGTEAMGRAIQLHRQLGFYTNPRWTWTAGVEAQIVTNQTHFWNSVANLQIGALGAEPILLEDALCTQRDVANLSKLRVVSVGYTTEKTTPLTILDGGIGFDRLSQFEAGNLLILLERSEYTPEIHNFLMEAHNESNCGSPVVLTELPPLFPAGIDLTAFFIPKDR